MPIEKFNHTIDCWITALGQYSVAALQARPTPTSWSIGQMYLHLIQDTGFYLDQLKVCLTTNEHAHESASTFVMAMLRNNEFPDLIIEGHPANATIPQPESKDQLLTGLEQIRQQANILALQMATTSINGKSLHPGFRYLTADEWLQLAEMHLRHHFRQKNKNRRLSETRRSVIVQPVLPRFLFAERVL